MANLIKVSIIKLDSRTFNESVLLNTNLITDVFTENSVTRINYAYKGGVRRIQVSESLSDINDAMGVYVNNVRIPSIVVETINNIKSGTSHSISVDDVLWIDKFTGSSVRLITDRDELVVSKTWQEMLDLANDLNEQLANLGKDDQFEMVKVATTSSLTLSNLKTIDTISCVAGDRVLVWKQSDAKLNGIYIVKSAASWVRASDCDGSAPEGELKSNRRVFVSNGSAHIGKTFVVDNESIPVVGTDDISFKAVDSVTAIGVGSISQDKFDSAFLAKVEKVDHLSVSQAVDLDAIETNSNASKVITDFITLTQAVDLDAIETNSNASKVITDFITLTQAVDLDAIETNSNASKVITDFIAVTQAVDLDNIETNSNASKVITDFITLTQAVDLDAIETNSNASKVITDFIAVTQAVDLDAIETNSNASKVITDFITLTGSIDLDAIKTKVDHLSVSQAVDLDNIETNSNASKVITDFITLTGSIDLDAIKTKVDAIENNATSDQSNSEIKTAYEANFSVAITSSGTNTQSAGGSVSFTFTANEGVLWDIVDTDTSGLSLNLTTGELSGSQNTTGDYNFVVYALGIRGGRTQQSFVLTLT